MASERNPLYLLNSFRDRNNIDSKRGPFKTQRSSIPYTPPNPEHYPHLYRWDTAFVASARAHFGDPEGATNELRALFDCQESNGFIPNQNFGPGRRLDPERLLTFKDSRRGSDYSQPPLEAQAVHDTYTAFNTKDPHKAQAFLQEMYPFLTRTYDYFIKNRENGSGSILIGNTHPHEHGRDGDPTTRDHVNLRLPTNGPSTPKGIATINAALSYGSTIALGMRMKQRGWRIENEEQNGTVYKGTRELYWVNDVMFNVLYANNLQQLAEISQKVGNVDDQKRYEKKGKTVEQEILTTMWDPTFFPKSGRGMFRGLREVGKENEKRLEYLDGISISNLFPVMLQTIPEEKLSVLLDCLADHKWFNPKDGYPIPSVPVYSSTFDPSYKEYTIWRGPTWINTNVMIAEGLLLQADREDLSANTRERALKRGLVIAEATKTLIEKSGYQESYDPFTGKAHRSELKEGFAWATVAHRLIDKIEQYKEAA